MSALWVAEDAGAEKIRDLLLRDGLLLIEVMTSFIYRGWTYIVIQHTDVTANG